MSDDFGAFVTVVLVDTASIVVVLTLLLGSVGIAMEYERGVVFRLGRFSRTAGPGLFLKIPFIESVTKVSQRIETNEIDKQEMISKDSISLNISAVVFFRVKDPRSSVIVVNDYKDAIDQYSLTTLRNVVGASTLDELLSERAKVADSARLMLDEVTEQWGVEAVRVEIKQIELPDDMKRAMAREAEAIREKRARITKAEAEKEASVKLAQAAENISRTPGALELRRLQTLSEVGAEHNSTIVLVMPQEILTAARALSGVRLAAE